MADVLISNSNWPLLRPRIRNDRAIRPSRPTTNRAPMPRTASDTSVPPRPDPSDVAAAASWDLVTRVQAGDKEAFGDIYDRYLDMIYRFVFYRVGHKQLAEDLTADTFLKALRSIGGITWQGRDLGAWLVTIARRLIIDYYKSGRYRAEAPSEEYALTPTAASATGPEWLTANLAADTAVIAAKNITNDALLAAVSRLRKDQQECIVLRFLLGMSIAETAEAMDTTEPAVKGLQLRAVRTLAGVLPISLRPS